MWPCSGRSAYKHIYCNALHQTFLWRLPYHSITDTSIEHLPHLNLSCLPTAEGNGIQQVVRVEGLSHKGRLFGAKLLLLYMHSEYQDHAPNMAGVPQLIWLGFDPNVL